MHNINTQLFMLVHSWAGKYPLLDRVVVALTSWVTVVVVLATGLYLIVVLPYREKDIYVRTRRFLQGLSVIGMTSVTWALCWVVKYTVLAPRPFEIIEGITHLARAVGSSFPSAHTTLTAALALSVWFYHKGLGRFLFGFAVLVGISRLFVGVHYPVDVVAGFLIGILVPLLLYRVFKK